MQPSTKKTHKPLLDISSEVMRPNTKRTLLLEPLFLMAELRSILCRPPFRNQLPNPLAYLHQYSRVQISQEICTWKPSSFHLAVQNQTTRLLTCLSKCKQLLKVTLQSFHVALLILSKDFPVPLTKCNLHCKITVQRCEGDVSVMSRRYRPC
jgi:hypothetical protein